MRKQIAAANWKMNLSLQEGITLLDDLLAAGVPMENGRETIFAVPFPYLPTAQLKIEGNANYYVAAQNCYDKKSGAYTGEVSATMLSSMGVTHCVIGHSERREYFNETNQMLAGKVNICLEQSITPIFCCGEPLAIREAGTQNEYVAVQLQESLFHLSPQELLKVVIAYEPIWAIGTGKTATTAQAQEMHASIRQVLAAKYGDEIASQISILYGGSVKAANAAELFACADVDGGLVGGASLIAAEFIAIMKALK